MTESSAWYRMPLFALVFLLVSASPRSQDEDSSRRSAASRQEDDLRLEISYGSDRIVVDGDRVYLVYGGYFLLRAGEFKVRADRAVLVFDRDEYDAWQSLLKKRDGLPHRGLISPISQESILRRRMSERLARLGFDLSGQWRSAEKLEQGTDRARFALGARQIYATGQVHFERRGIRSLHCEKLFLSLVSDRAVMEKVELRLPLGTPMAPRRASLVVICPKLTQQANRLIAYDARLSTCDAGEPHFYVESRRLTVIRHESFNEYVGEGNLLKVGSLPALPLPDYRHYSDQENWIPIKGASVGSSDERGAFGLVELGGRWNGVGQHLVDLFSSTERSFRGEWAVRTGWTKKRGSPIEPSLSYFLPSVFQGDVDAFFLEDRGRDRRSVQTFIDGTPISERGRSFVRTRNRVSLGEHSRVDIEGFWGSDPAAYAEFRPDNLKESEPPESSVQLRFVRDNIRATLTGRTTLPGFSYDETARLTARFRGERPYGRFALFSEPLARLGDAWPLVMDLELGAGLLRNEFDDRAASAVREASWRGDGGLMLSAPRVLGPYAVKPFVRLRETWYSDRPGGSAAGRELFEFGGLVSTRFSRRFEGGLQHVIQPEIRAFHRTGVSREPGDYFQFDRIDALDEESAVDLVLLNRLRVRGEAGTESDLLWIDLAQRVHPNSTRDNGGDRLGLFAFEAILTSGAAWLPLPHTRLLFEGERDWNKNVFRTRNVGMALGPIRGFGVGGEWRSGADGDGTGSIFLSAQLWQRWSLSLGAIYNFELNRKDATSFTLLRKDHDWSWVISIAEDENTGDRSFRVQFIPTFGGLFRPRRTRYIAGDPAFGVRNGSGF